MEVQDSSFWSFIRRRMLKKHESQPEDARTDLKRSLTTLQLTFLGLSGTVGVGIYVVLGIIIDQAGPSVVLCFIMAVCVSLVTALVLAELAILIPETGGAYVYVYKVYGECAAFITGISLIFAYLEAISCNAQAWSAMLDSIFNNSIRTWTLSTVGEITIGPPFAGTIDIPAGILQVFITITVATSMSCTSAVNTVVTPLTIALPLFPFVVGLVYGNSQNFLASDHGGFFPFGAEDMLKGVFLALYPTRGYECIGMSAEETKNPARSIPIATIITVSTAGGLYIALAVGTLYLVPYWLVDIRAPLQSAFQYAGLTWGQLFVTAAPMIGGVTYLVTTMFMLSRYIYRMARDGLFFPTFLVVDEVSGTPRNAAILAGVTTIFMSVFLDLNFIIRLSVLLSVMASFPCGTALIKLNISDEFDNLDGTSPKSRSTTPSCNGNDEDKQLCLEKTKISNYGILEEFKKSASVKDKFLLFMTESDFIEQLKTREIEITRYVGNGESHIPSMLQDSKNSNDWDISNVTQITCQLSKEISNQESKTSTDSIDVPSITETPFEAMRDSNEGGRNTFSQSQHSSSTDTGLFDKSCTTKLQENQKVILENSSTCSGFEHIKKESPISVNPNDNNVSCYLEWSNRLVPGVISPNTLLLVHLLTCGTLAGQVIYGHAQLLSLQPASLVLLVFLLILLLASSLCLASLCSGAKHNNQSFRTPFMPLFPTLHNFLTAAMFFAVINKLLFTAMACIISFASMAYMLLLIFRYYSDNDQDAREETNENRISR